MSFSPWNARSINPNSTRPSKNKLLQRIKRIQFLRLTRTRQKSLCLKRNTSSRVCSLTCNRKGVRKQAKKIKRRRRMRMRQTGVLPKQAQPLSKAFSFRNSSERINKIMINWTDLDCQNWRIDLINSKSFAFFVSFKSESSDICFSLHLSFLIRCKNNSFFRVNHQLRQPFSL